MLRSHFMADACGNPLTYCYSGLCLVTKQRGGIISAACRRYMMQPIYRQYPQVKARHHLLLDPDVTQGFAALAGTEKPGSEQLTPSTGWYGESLLRAFSGLRFTHCSQ